MNQITVFYRRLYPAFAEQESLAIIDSWKTKSTNEAKIAGALAELLFWQALVDAGDE